MKRIYLNAHYLGYICEANMRSKCIYEMNTSLNEYTFKTKLTLKHIYSKHTYSNEFFFKTLSLNEYLLKLYARMYYFLNKLIMRFIYNNQVYMLDNSNK